MSAAPRKRGAGTVSRKERSRQLLDVALEIVLESGYGALTMAGVAAGAGVSKPIVYRIYPNRQALLVALLRREQKRAESALDEAVPADPGERHPRDVLVGAARGVLEAIAERPSTWRLVLLQPEGTPRLVREIVQRSRERFLRRTRRLVGWGAPYLDSDEEIDLDILSRFLLAIIEEQGRLLLTDPDVDSKKILASTETIVGAVGWRLGSDAAG